MTRVKVRFNNTTDYTLSKAKAWGEAWGTEPPTTISAKATANCTVNDDDRAGLVYLATDDAGNEMGYVTMSFTCPKWSDNSAEGSPAVPGIFISAGLQHYKEEGTPVDLSYHVGADNLACWDDGSSNNGSLTCDQTRMATWTRALVSVQNPTKFELTYVDKWSESNSEPSRVWSKLPVSVPPGGRRIVTLNNNDRAGLYYRAMLGDQERGYVTMSFTCPKASHNSAEGSSFETGVFLDAGLQTYERSGTPVNFTYIVDQKNLAGWNSGTSDSGIKACDQTQLNGRAKIVVRNDTEYEVASTHHWDESGGSEGWYFNPDGPIPSNARKLLVLSTNDRAGIYYVQNDLEYHLSFTCPKLSHNSAEGSDDSGLQPYEDTGTPVLFEYKLGTRNLACWRSGKYDDGKIVVSKTKVPAKLPKDKLEEAVFSAKMSNLAYSWEDELRAALGAWTPSYELCAFFDDSKYDTQGFLAWNAAEATAVLAFRGTESIADVNTDLYQEQVALLPELPSVKVVAGFLYAFEAIEKKLETAVDALLKEVTPMGVKRFYVTGHSLGGALATLAAVSVSVQLYDQKYGPGPKDVPLRMVTVAAPPVGNKAFKHYFQDPPAPARPFLALTYGAETDPVPTGKWTVPDLGIGFDFEVWDYVQSGELVLLSTDTPFPSSHYVDTYIAVLEEMLKVVS